MPPLTDPDRLAAFKETLGNWRYTGFVEFELPEDAFLVVNVHAPEQAKEFKRPRDADRPFPWRCRCCGQVAVDLATISYQAQVRHEGHTHTFDVPRLQIPVCAKCGEKLFTVDVDDQINAALRSHLHLLSPDEIGAALDRLNLSPSDLAERLGVDETLLASWLDHFAIQSRAMDNLLRVYFAFPEVRTALSRAFCSFPPVPSK